MPLLRSLPNAALASVILFACASLIQISDMRRLWRINRIDLFLMLATIAATLGLGVMLGLSISIGVSLLLTIQQSSRPHWAEVAS